MAKPLKRNPKTGAVICADPPVRRRPAGTKPGKVPTHRLFRQTALFRSAGRSWL